MKKRSIVLIFADPSLYFFPRYKDVVYPPFCSQRKGVWYLLYRALFWLGCPLCHIFWGEWKEAAKTAEKVVIFDYGYEKGMETYIKKVNPDCQVYFFCWNKVDKAHSGYRNFRFPQNIYSTDPGDCRRYGFRYNHMFYPRTETRTEGESGRLFFVGTDKGRASYLAALGSLLKSCGVVCDIRILGKGKKRKSYAAMGLAVMERPMKYAEYLENVKKSGILLEIVQSGQTGISMRTTEAIFLSKKLITNNRDIVTYDFYCENNIFVLPTDLESVTGEAIREFLAKPFLPYPEEILEAYSFEDWQKNFCEG